MSGSSLDGLDVVYAKVRGGDHGYKILKVHHLFQPYQKKMAQMAEEISQENLLKESFLFGSAWSIVTEKAIQKLLKKHSISIDSIDAVGVHGQAVLHDPKFQKFLGHPANYTIQLANLSLLAEKLGITVVGNFRQRDLSVGGQGAPLMPHIHEILFGSAFPCLSVHNLGGISNPTIIKNGKVVTAFDTGPANTWIDTVVKWHTDGKQKMDRDGRLAQRGIPDLSLVSELLSHPYFERKPPKSTGWEDFGPNVLLKYKRYLMDLPKEDAVATVTWATVDSIVQAYRKFVLPKHKSKRSFLQEGAQKIRILFRRFSAISRNQNSKL